MPIGGGFYSEEQADSFAAASAATQFGAPARAICGARNRRGSVCARTAILEGRGRCLLHCGPKAAGEFRERQHRAYLSGRLSYADWTRQEAHRAANRLGDRWKRNPWLPGTTIDLGHHEAACRAALFERGLDVGALAPAVADWLRWRFRRVQIDRVDDRAWQRVLTEALPARITRAGVRPLDVDLSVASGGLGRARTWTAATARGRSKRHTADKPRAPRVIRGKGHLRAGRPRTQPPQEDDLASLMALYREHRGLVAPMMAACPHEGDRLDVLRALRAIMTDPDNKAARDRWLTLVRLLRPT